MERITTYSVYNHASGAYMHITATSKKHVRTYLREKGWDIYCDKDINMLNNWGEGYPIEKSYPEWFGLPGTNID